MKEKKATPPKSTPGILVRTFHEILIADKRSYEPFVKVFRAEGENVSKLDLGTLVGVFEVDEKDEDAAYIVNFLASVAKKEYFNNPRRGPIESFEAALHKVNVALAELVKHGNVSWLGKLHGVLAVLEKNNLHFSVTGEAALLLFRQEQFSEISEGLASNEASVHPLKTFVEVSSGRLMEEDNLILSTPELLALFPLDYLTKQAVRMNAQAFRQFLRTALVNEIDMAAVLAIELSVASPEASTSSLKTKTEPRPKNQPVANAFSQATFTPSKAPIPLDPEPAPLDSSLSKEEFIDEKTGHIYVQGDEIGDSSSLKHSVILESVREVTSRLGEFFSRTVRRQGKKTARLGAFLLWESRTQTARLGRKAAQKITALKVTLAEQQKTKAAQKVRQLEKKVRQETKRQAEALVEPVILAEKPLPVVLPAVPSVEEAPEVMPEPSLEVPVEKAVPAHIERFRSFYQEKPEKKEKPGKEERSPSLVAAPTRPQESSHISLETKLVSKRTKIPFNVWKVSLGKQLRALKASIKTFSRVILKRQKILFISLGGLLVIASGGFWFLHTKTTPQANEQNDSKTVAPISTPSPSETNTLEAESTVALNKELVSLVFLENQSYGATAKSIVALENNEEFTIPDIKGEVRFMSPMEDLRLIFILTSQNELFAWSPLAKTFTKNELVLPANARVTGIGTYLTYLYVLDRGNNQLYRYPRSVSGFQESASWMKESFELTDTAFLAINETVALAPSREHLLSFSQGKNTGTFDLSDPKKPMTLQALTTDSDFPFIYGLDEENTLSIWNLDRKLLHTYTLKDAPKDASYLASDPEKKTLILGNKDGNITRYTNVTSE